MVEKIVQMDPMNLVKVLVKMVQVRDVQCTRLDVAVLALVAYPERLVVMARFIVPEAKMNETVAPLEEKVAPVIPSDVGRVNVYQNTSFVTQ